MLCGFIRLRPASFTNKSTLTRFKHNMRLVQFVEAGRQRVGVEIKDGGDVVDVSAGDPSIPSDMRSFLEGGEDMMKKARRCGISYEISHILMRLTTNILFENCS